MNVGNGYIICGLWWCGCIYVLRGCLDDMFSELDIEWGVKEIIFWFLLCCLCLCLWFCKNEKKKYKLSYYWILFIYDS